MSLWGASDTTESKPKNLTVVEQQEVFATESGWVRGVSKSRGNDNPNADAEVLCCIKGLGILLGSADLVRIEFVDADEGLAPTFDKSDGGTIRVRATFNEAVEVSNTIVVNVTNTTSSARNLELTYEKGTGTNEITFAKTIAAANAATDADDVLTLQGMCIVDSTFTGSYSSTASDTLTTSSISDASQEYFDIQDGTTTGLSGQRIALEQGGLLSQGVNTAARLANGIKLVQESGEGSGGGDGVGDALVLQSGTGSGDTGSQVGDFMFIETTDTTNDLNEDGTARTSAVTITVSA